MRSTVASPLRVLLIEDESFTRGTIKQMLRALGCGEVQEAADGNAAFRLLDAMFFPELIICDVHMAPLDGLGFLRMLRSSGDPVRAAVPVIMLTAAADKETVKDTASLNVSAYVLKPVTLLTLAERINAIFRPGRDQPKLASASL